jgi:methylenetetrahydrofolate reductase (NADPH)
MDLLMKDYIEMGVDNILALRGDPPKEVHDYNYDQGEFKIAKDLVEFVGKYDKFSISVAVYPEGHAESPSIEKDMEYTKMKIDAGADFGITQMFFDNVHFHRFMDRADKAGITIPILPGILPVSDFKKVQEFAGFCNATIPKAMHDWFTPYMDSPEDTHKRGIEYAVKQCEDLLKNGVKYIHFYTLNKSESVSGILDALGHSPA